MKCMSCEVRVDAVHTVCPLCRRSLDGHGSLPVNRWYPAYAATEEEPSAGGLTSRWLAFAAMAVICVALFINVLSGHDVWWSLYVVPCVLFAWLFIKHTVMSGAHPGAKIIVQFLALSGLLLWIDSLSGTDWWSANYVIPFMEMAATALISVICATKPLRLREFAGYLLTMIVLGFMPLLLHAAGMSQVLWPSAAAALYAALTFGGMWLLADKGFRKEVKRRLHY